MVILNQLVIKVISLIADPDLFGPIRIRTFGTRSGSEATKIDIFLPFLC
jgi:hypothetical protein